jgi:TIR domain
MTAKIFLAHAREDKLQVRKLYADLATYGLDPWLDERDLLPGHIWKDEIAKAIHEARIFLACLSSRSVGKIGYVQNEFRLALSALGERPPGSIFLIPVRLDECNVPDLRIPDRGLSFQDIQWVDLWEDGGFHRLIKAIEHAIDAPTCRQASRAKDPTADLSSAPTAESLKDRLVRMVAAEISRREKYLDFHRSSVGIFHIQFALAIHDHVHGKRVLNIMIEDDAAKRGGFFRGYIGQVAAMIGETTIAYDMIRLLADEIDKYNNQQAYAAANILLRLNDKIAATQLLRRLQTDNPYPALHVALGLEDKEAMYRIVKNILEVHGLGTSAIDIKGETTDDILKVIPYVPGLKNQLLNYIVETWEFGEVDIRDVALAGKIAAALGEQSYATEAIELCREELTYQDDGIVAAGVIAAMLHDTALAEELIEEYLKLEGANMAYVGVILAFVCRQEPRATLALVDRYEKNSPEGTPYMAMQILKVLYP